MFSFSPARATRRMFSTSSAAPVIFEQHGRIQHVILNKPKALNALDLSMVRLLSAQLAGIEEHAQVQAVLLKGAGKAFCAGGDIKTLWAAKGSIETAHRQDEFFREEYALDYRLALGNHAKPVIAVYDGTVMGGGVGISVNAAFRIATEKALFAMPETGIGLFPDVGGSYFLPRIPHHFGTYLALTGHKLRGADIVHAGVATHFVPSERLGYLEGELASMPALPAPQLHAAISRTITRHAAALPPFSFGKEVLATLGSAFSHNTVEKIVAELASAVDMDDKAGAAAAASALQVLSRMSPTSLKVTLHQMRLGARLTLQQCYAMELRLALRFMAGQDFYEGVRAALVDKDGTPRWHPPQLEAVTDEAVRSYFKPLPADKEWQFSPVTDKEAQAQAFVGLAPKASKHS